MRSQVVLALLALAVLAPSAHAATHPCKDAPKAARCGSVTVPLDRGDPGGKKLRIGYERYPARRLSQGTMVAVEGGPGYSTTDSRRTTSSSCGR